MGLVRSVKSWFYILKVKWYLKVIKEEIWIKVLGGDPIPEFHCWKRLEELLHGGKNES